MTVMDLSDEELLRAIKTAREFANDGSVPFELALNTALETTVKRKEAKASTVTVDVPEERYEDSTTLVEEAIEVPEEREEDATTIVEEAIEVPEEVEQTRNVPTADSFIRSRWERIDELSQMAWPMIHQSNNPIGLRDFYQKAKQGGLSDEYMDLHVKDFQQGPRDSGGLGDILASISDLERQTYYAYYALSDEAEIERQRQEAIKMYERLRDKGIEAHNVLDIDRKWNHEAATTTVAGDISIQNAKDNAYGVFGVGMTSFEEGMELRPGVVSLSPADYDTTYYMIKGRLTSDGEFHNKRMFEEAQTICDSELNKIREMSTDDFRNYKLSQMRLTQNERERFDGAMGLGKEEEASMGSR